MHTLIDQRRAEIALLCRRFGVRQLEVFGSAARGDDFNPDTSDADSWSSLPPDSTLPPLQQFFGLADALERVSGARWIWWKKAPSGTPLSWPALSTHTRLSILTTVI